MLTVPDILVEEVHDVISNMCQKVLTIIQTVFTKPDTILLLHVQTNITQVKCVCVLQTVLI